MYALPTVGLFMAVIALFAVLYAVQLLLPVSLQKSTPFRQVFTAQRYLSYRTYRLSWLNWNSAPLGVLILGIGLSMGEAMAGPITLGHGGPVTAIARRGRRAERGTVAAPSPFGDFAAQGPLSALSLLRLFRAEVRRPARSRNPVTI